jgi:hypothetical protein
MGGQKLDLWGGPLRPLGKKCGNSEFGAKAPNTDDRPFNWESGLGGFPTVV